jgi:hypothetical protein
VERQGEHDVIEEGVGDALADALQLSGEGLAARTVASRCHDLSEQRPHFVRSSVRKRLQHLGGVARPRHYGDAMADRFQQCFLVPCFEAAPSDLQGCPDQVVDDEEGDTP